MGASARLADLPMVLGRGARHRRLPNPGVADFGALRLADPETGDVSAANRRRGHDAERAVVLWLRDHGYPDAHTTRSQLGHDGFHAPGDVVGPVGLVIEVKDVAASCWPTWCRQAELEAGDLAWVVVRRLRGNPDVAAWPCKATTKWGTVFLPRSPTIPFGDYIDWWENGDLEEPA